ncbi:hypothetical protein [Bradyrhizobium sp. Ec3.3]|uniref:hypothetical protein n=1 Tax=Bradyrhizobium sp. Ec3.3 TaxID=189753 RepID=UPI0012EC1CB7|nr:hypothetical protein [Bradyrhizobium sp. Ec3.3]
MDQLEPGIIIRPFAEEDADQVRRLFVRVNRLLAPPHRAEAFEQYIAVSLDEEIGQISRYYSRRQGGFWKDNGDSVQNSGGLSRGLSVMNLGAYNFSLHP